MVENTKVPANAGADAPAASATWFPFDTLRRQVDRLFEDFGDGWHWPAATPMPSAGSLFRRFDWKVPAVDVAEKDHSFEITAEIPGVDANQIDVTLHNGNLVIRGEKQDEAKEETKDYHLRERHYGSFERAFPIPEGADPDRIDARFANGVLTITLPKTTAALRPERKVDIKAA